MTQQVIPYMGESSCGTSWSGIKEIMLNLSTFVDESAEGELPFSELSTFIGWLLGLLIFQIIGSILFTFAWAAREKAPLAGERIFGFAVPIINFVFILIVTSFAIMNNVTVSSAADALSGLYSVNSGKCFPSAYTIPSASVMDTDKWQS